jgi:hypothetical protein
MNPSPNPDQDSKAKLEMLVLCAVCQGTPQGPVRDAALRLLKDYRWREPVHEAMFRCLAQLSAANFRDELPACLTRKGFPDVDWNALFDPQALTKDEVERLMQELRDS